MGFCLRRPPQDWRAVELSGPPYEMSLRRFKSPIVQRACVSVPGVVEAHESDRHRYPRLDGDLYLIARFHGKAFAVLNHAVCNHADHVADVLSASVSEGPRVDAPRASSAGQYACQPEGLPSKSSSGSTTTLKL